MATIGKEIIKGTLQKNEDKKVSELNKRISSLDETIKKAQQEKEKLIIERSIKNPERFIIVDVTSSEPDGIVTAILRSNRLPRIMACVSDLFFAGYECAIVPITVIEKIKKQLYGE